MADIFKKKGILLKKPKPEEVVEKVEETPAAIVETIPEEKPEIVGDITDSTPVDENADRKYDFVRNVYGDILDHLTGDKFTPEEVATVLKLEAPSKSLEGHSPKYIKRLIGDSWVADQVIQFLQDNPGFNWGTKTYVSKRSKDRAKDLRDARSAEALAAKPALYRKKTNEIEAQQIEDFIGDGSDAAKVLKRKRAEELLLELAAKEEARKAKEEWKDEGDIINEVLKAQRY